MAREQCKTFKNIRFSNGFIVRIFAWPAKERSFLCQDASVYGPWLTVWVSPRPWLTGYDSRAVSVQLRFSICESLQVFKSFFWSSKVSIPNVFWGVILLPNLRYEDFPKLLRISVRNLENSKAWAPPLKPRIFSLFLRIPPENRLLK